ncbi:Protein of unknown function [Bacillus mycoides]|nr:Protein of unknown function [Bacillus mycoides]
MNDILMWFRSKSITLEANDFGAEFKAKWAEVNK